MVEPHGIMHRGIVIEITITTVNINISTGQDGLNKIIISWSAPMGQTPWHSGMTDTCVLCLSMKCCWLSVHCHRVSYTFKFSSCSSCSCSCSFPLTIKLFFHTMQFKNKIVQTASGNLIIIIYFPGVFSIWPQIYLFGCGKNVKWIAFSNWLILVSFRISPILFWKIKKFFTKNRSEEHTN